jgi:Holliday junction resolvase
MANANKRKGSQFEVDLKNGLREAGLDVERLPLNGSSDEGDLVIRNGIITIAEAKNEQRLDLPRYYRELQAEVENYRKARGLAPEAVDGVIIHKRRNHNWRKAWVTTTVEDYFNLKESNA